MATALQKGGVQSGFKHARTNVSEVKRILHLKGRRSVRATEVELDWSALNQGDVFIIEIENVSVFFCVRIS